MGDIKLLTPEQVADYLGISVNTIYKRSAPGAKDKFPIPARRFGRCLRFRSDDVQEHIKSIKAS